MKEADELIAGEFYYTKRKKSKSGIKVHVAQYNETLWDISQQHGIKMSSLAKLNRMTIIDEIKPGRVMWLSQRRPKDEPVQYHELQKPIVDEDEIEKPLKDIAVADYAPASDQNSKVKFHTVAKGESLWGIAKKYGISVEEIQRWNELENADSIDEGQNLQVKAPIGERTERQVVDYKVVKGDNLYQISRKFDMSVDDIMELNDMHTSDLSEGQKLKVYKD